VTTTTRSRPEVRAAAPVARRRSLRGYLFVLPALLFYVTFAILPALHTAYLSLFDWDGITLATFVGPANYLEVLTDPDLRAAVVHALVLVVFFSWIRSCSAC
jgi:ABC-type sugar transport system permease subunit